MKLSKRKLGLIAGLLIGLTVGLVVGIFGASYLYYRHVFLRVTDRNAADLGFQIATLSKLRLGELDAVIDDLEMRVDGNVISVALTPHIPRTDYRYRVLRAAKTYREIYPSKSERASQVGNALKEIPKIDTFGCDSYLCRLVKRTKENKTE